MRKNGFHAALAAAFMMMLVLPGIADAENQTLRYRELERKVVGITATMLTKCLRELEADGLITRTQFNTIPPTVEYSLTERGRTLIPALESVYHWAEGQMNSKPVQIN